MKIVFLCKTDDDGFRSMIRVPVVVDARAWFAMSGDDRARAAQESILGRLHVSYGHGDGPRQAAIAHAVGGRGFMADAMCRFSCDGWARLDIHQRLAAARAAIMPRLMFGWCRASARRHHGKQRPAEGWAYRSSQER